MAVVDKYTDVNVAAKNKTLSVLTGVGNHSFNLIGQAAIAAADDDGSVYRLFKDVPANYILASMRLTNSAITGGTDYDIGLYNRDLGAIKDKDVFLDGATMATARTVKTNVDSLTAVVELDVLKSLSELAGDTTNPPLSYDLCLTANTVGTVAGTVTVWAEFVQK